MAKAKKELISEKTPSLNEKKSSRMSTGVKAHANQDKKIVKEPTQALESQEESRPSRTNRWNSGSARTSLYKSAAIKNAQRRSSVLF